MMKDDGIITISIGYFITVLFQIILLNFFFQIIILEYNLINHNHQFFYLFYN